MRQDPANRQEAAKRILSCFLNQSTKLSLSDLPITSLPECIHNLTSLEILGLSYTRLTSLPDCIGNLSVLKTLGLSGTHITSLPESFGNLTALTDLYLSHIPITSLPSSILNLSSNLEVDLSNCQSLSDAVLTRLAEATQVAGYRGPSFSYSIRDYSGETPTPSLEEALKATYEKAHIDMEDLGNLLSGNETFKENLSRWLDRLKGTANGKSKSSEGFYKTIIENLKLANTSPEFRDLFSAIIVDACTTCGDRVALSVLQLGVQRRLFQCDKTDLKAFTELLKGAHALLLLETVAKNKIPTLKFFDEIEVYLGYPIKLKEALNLPIDIDRMLYFGCSALKDSDLEEARVFVKSIIDNADTFADHLTSRDDWKAALKATLPKEFQVIEIQKKRALDEEAPDYKQIDLAYKQAIKELTLGFLTTS